MTIPVAILASAFRVVAGLFLGFIAAVATGILVSMSRTASAAVLPIVRGLAPIAPIAWIPIGIIVFGIGNPTAVFVVFTGVYFLLTLSTVAAVQSVDPRLVKTARTFGASRAQVWAWVIFPAVLPQVFTMLRLNFFAAWMAVLAAEMVGLKNGVGMIVILGREMFNPNLIMLGICIIGVTGYAVDALLLFVQTKDSLVEGRRMSSLQIRQGEEDLGSAPRGLQVEAIRDVSLEVSSGEFVAILGPSGCGKSTLLELCAGLEPVSGGEILIDGEKVAGPEPQGGDGVPGAFAVSLAERRRATWCSA